MMMMMEGSQVSPERLKLWKERGAKCVQNRKVVPVVYYLSRNRKLEHPHFIEVAVSSPQGLYLRDVIERLNVLRGRGMASIYSWSCKRSYKNGFVWHDLSEDDLILPAQGNDYVLKGSEIIEGSNSGHFSEDASFGMHEVKYLPGPPSFRIQDEASSSSTLNGIEIKNHRENQISPSEHSGFSDISPGSTVKNHSARVGSLSLTEYKPPYRATADASTQTEESDWEANGRETCSRGVATDDETLDVKCNNDIQSGARCSQNNPSIQEDCSHVSCSPSESSFGHKSETLKALIRADVGTLNSPTIPGKRSVPKSPTKKLKASTMLIQLISCGSIYVKDRGLGLLPSYRSASSHPKFSSPLFSTSMMLGEHDCSSESRRLLSLRLDNKEHFSGSLIETKILEEGKDIYATLKHTTPYNSERFDKRLGSVDVKEVTMGVTGQSMCAAQSMEASVIKQLSCESMRSHYLSKPRQSTDGFGELLAIANDSFIHCSGRMTEPILGRGRLRG